MQKSDLLIPCPSFLNHKRSNFKTFKAQIRYLIGKKTSTKCSRTYINPVTDLRIKVI